MDSAEETSLPPPEPEKSGVVAVQQRPLEERARVMVKLPETTEGLRQDSVAETLREIGEQGVRGPVGMALLYRLIYGLECDLKDAKTDQKKRQTELAWISTAQNLPNNSLVGAQVAGRLTRFSVRYSVLR